MPTSRRQRVAFVITELAVGGAEKCLANLAAGIDRTRFEPVVVTLAKRPDHDVLVRGLEAQRVPVHFLNLSTWRQSWAGLRRLTALLRELQPNVVQTFLFHANVLGAMAVARANSPPLFAGARVADPRWGRLAVERWALSRAAAIICVSDSVLEHYERQGFRRQQLLTISNGIDVESWLHTRPAKLETFAVPQGRRTILFVGRLDRQKGVDILLDAMPAVCEALPEVDLLIVGDGPERDHLHTLATRLAKFSGRIHFAGWQADIPEIMKASEVVVLPSRWEGMPNVLLESMAAGLPVVAAATHGVRQLLGSHTEQQMFSLEDTRELSARLIAILQDPNLQSRLGHANQVRAAQEFSLRSMIRQYEQLYSAGTAH